MKKLKLTKEIKAPEHSARPSASLVLERGLSTKDSKRVETLFLDPGGLQSRGLNKWVTSIHPLLPPPIGFRLLPSLAFLHVAMALPQFK